MKTVGGILISAFLFTCHAGCCVLEGTLVDTPSGRVAVESLRIGQEVVCSSPSGEHRIGRVTGIKKATAFSYLEFQFEGSEQRLGVTSSHPLATENGWVSAAAVEVGDTVRTRTGMSRVVEVATHLKTARVYDISISPYPNFFANGILVHNKSRTAPAKAEDLPGVWIGYLYHHWGTMYRLELQADGTGVLACINQTDPRHLHIYRITEWSLNRGKLGFVLSQIDPGIHAVPLKLEGRAPWSGRLDLEIREQVASGTWKRFSGLKMEPLDGFLQDLHRQQDDADELAARTARFKSDGVWESPCQR